MWRGVIGLSWDVVDEFVAESKEFCLFLLQPGDLFAHAVHLQLEKRVEKANLARKSQLRLKKKG